MTNQPTLVLVEPLCRGSRLQILVNLVSALKSYRRVIVLTREDFDTPHFAELMAPHRDAVRMVTAATDLGGQWTKILTRGEFACFLRRLVELEREIGPGYDLVWIALDDYLGAFARAGIRIRRRLHPRRVLVGKWRVEYLLPGQVGPRKVALRWLTRVALHTWRAELLVFDERLEAEHLRCLRVHRLVDPWFGDFSPRWREPGRRRAGFGADQCVVLTVGRQDERKGFPLVIETFDRLLASETNLVLWVIGPVAETSTAAFNRLKARFGDERVRHNPQFVPEAEMPAVFAAADVVLLPYSPMFNASSGVLPRAAASGVPVLASDHGLVGYRVRRWSLGRTFSTGSVDAFCETLLQMLAGGHRLKPGGLGQFAQTCDLHAFEVAVRKAILEEPA